MKIRSLTLALWLCLASLLSAQNINVASFNLDPKDLTANLEGTTVYDQNGQKCALIRIQTTQKGFSFDVGSLGVQKVDDNKVGEIWLYVPEGVKRLTMRHAQLGTLEKWPFPINIMGSKTYMMYITTANVHTVVEDADVFFPEIDPRVWEVVSKSETHRDEQTGFEFEFVVYKKRR